MDKPCGKCLECLRDSDEHTTSKEICEYFKTSSLNLHLNQEAERNEV